MCSILQVSKEFPSMVWLSLLLVMSLSHSTIGRSGNEVIYVSGVVKLVLIHCVTAPRNAFFFSKCKAKKFCSNRI